MALGGDLRNINLADIFQTLTMNQQVGTLVVRSGSKEKRIAFSGSGVSLSSGRTIPGFRLGKYLRGCGRISDEDLRTVLAEQRQSGELLGKIVTRLGLCSAEDVEEVIRYHAAEELYEIFTWTEGEFEFIEGAASDAHDRPSPYALIQFDAGGIVMEAARRLDEWSRFREFVPSDEDFLGRTGEGGERLDAQKWGQDLASVYDLVDGTRSVREILDDFHLAAFDVAMILRDLVSHKLVRPSSFEELVESAWRFLDKRNVLKAAKCLERAHALRPTDLDVLQQLAGCYERLDEKRSAARCLATAGRIRLEGGDPTGAIDALEKAEKFDPGSEDAPILLIRAYQQTGRGDHVAEKARAAASILVDKQQFERAVELCQAGLAGSPDHVGLRVVLANAHLGMGQKSRALEELESIAASLEGARSPRKLEEIYKKILQLDSSRREYLRRLQELKEGAVRRRRRLLHAAALGGGGLLLLLVSFFLFTGGMSAEEKLSKARDLLDSGELDEALRLTDEIVRDEDPESETVFEARTLQFAIGLKRESDGPAKAAAAELGNRLEELFAPAAAQFRDEHWEEGLDHLLEFTAFLTSDAAKVLGGKAGEEFVEQEKAEYVKSTVGLLTQYADRLAQIAEATRNELARLTEAQPKFPQAELADVRAAMEKANELRTAIEPDPRRRALEKAQSVEISVAGQVKVYERLETLAKDLDGQYGELTTIYHVARARVRRDEIRDTFETELLSRVSDLKNIGDLDAAQAVCRDFIVECEKLKAERPENIYAATVADLFADDRLDLDGKATKELAVLAQVKGDLERAEALVAQGRYEAANALLRELVGRNFRIDFKDLVRLSMLVRTRPVEATVSLAWEDEPKVVLGRAGPEGLLVRYPPLGKTTIEISHESFETHRIVVERLDEPAPANPTVALLKIPEWTWSGAGPFQATPVRWGDRILTASRDGLLRAFDRTGKPGPTFDTELLSGFAAPPLVDGDVAILAALDRRLLAVDLGAGKTLFSLPVAEPLRTPPILVGRTAVVADENGAVYGFADGAEKWRRSIPGRVQADPVRIGDDVVVGTTEGRLARLSAATGEPVWDVAPGGRIQTLLATGAGADAVIYVGTDASEVIAVSAADGEVRWRRNVDNGVRGRLARYDDRLALATLAGTVYVLDAGSGEIVHQATPAPETPIESGVTAGPSGLYVVDAAGSLHALSKDLTPRWTFSLGAAALSPPLAEGPRLYVVTEAGEVFAFRD